MYQFQYRKALGMFFLKHLYLFHSFRIPNMYFILPNNKYYFFHFFWEEGLKQTETHIAVYVLIQNIIFFPEQEILLKSSCLLLHTSDDTSGLQSLNFEYLETKMLIVRSKIISRFKINIQPPHISLPTF